MILNVCVRISKHCILGHESCSHLLLCEHEHDFDTMEHDLPGPVSQIDVCR